MLFHRELAENQNVCTQCGHHMAITPRERFRHLFDGGIFTEIDVPAPTNDPLQFRDQKKYPERMKAAQKKTGEKEAKTGTPFKDRSRLQLELFEANILSPQNRTFATEAIFQNRHRR